MIPWHGGKYYQNLDYDELLQMGEEEEEKEEEEEEEEEEEVEKKRRM